MATTIELITDALVECGVYDIGEAISGEHVTFCLARLNRIIDQWAARKVYVWNVAFTAYTLTALHQPHLIGPGLVAPDFAAPRPVRIENAALILTTSTPSVDLPLNLRDDDWWANKRVKSLTSSVPTDLYYSPDHPSGALWLWPIPNYAYGLRLETWVALAQITDATLAFSAPYGYELALMLTLAEEVCGPMGRSVPTDLAAKAARARAAIQRNNDKSPRIDTAEAGTRGRSTRGDFNYYTGGPSYP
jgi:hypothetical protein